jgi:hypothetical protein
MKFPQEVITWKVLPAIRAKLALKLRDQGLTQREVAEILGLTAPAVSQYFSGKRAADFAIGTEYEKYFDKILKHIETKPEKAKSIVMDVCSKIERTEQFKEHLG